MKVTGKPVPTSVGIVFIGFAVLAGAAGLSGAREAQSPILYIFIFGGLFVGIPAALGIGVVVENRRSNLKEADSLERRGARFIPGPIWLAIGAASGFLAGRGMGTQVFKISVFQHTIAAGVFAACFIATFLLGRKRLPELSGWCLWLGTFCIGLLSLR